MGNEHETSEDNSKFTEDIKEALEFNQRRRDQGNGAERPVPDLSKLGDLLQQKASEKQVAQNQEEGTAPGDPKES